MTNNKKILVVDDNVDLALLTKSYLEHKGYLVLLAHDGEQALRVLASDKPDLMLLDVTMPKKNGLDVYKAICTTHGNTRIPVLFVTAHEEFKKIFEDIEVDGFISKPFEFEALGTKIEKVLATREAVRVVIIDYKTNPHSEQIIDALCKEKYRAVMVEGLQEFISLLASGRPEFVLMEYLRGDMPGDAFIHLLKEVDPNINLAVYSFSGFDFTEKSLKAGADEYLGKPETPEAFVTAVRKLEIKKMHKQHEG